MKRNHHTTAALGLLGLLAAAAAAQAPADWKLSEPYTHQNIAVFLIRGPDTHPG